jgi:hypothetical protein
MDPEPMEELEGQTSINELLDNPVGTVPIQLVLPIPDCPRPAVRTGKARRIRA